MLTAATLMSGNAEYRIAAGTNFSDNPLNAVRRKISFELIGMNFERAR